MWYARVLEIIGQTILGDGITCLMLPRKHWLLWVDAFPGLPAWRKLLLWYADRPKVTVATGLLECAIGTAMILRANRDR